MKIRRYSQTNLFTLTYLVRKKNLRAMQKNAIIKCRNHKILILIKQNKQSRKKCVTVAHSMDIIYLLCVQQHKRQSENAFHLQINFIKIKIFFCLEVGKVLTNKLNINRQISCSNMQIKVDPNIMFKNLFQYVLFNMSCLVFWSYLKFT